MFVFENVNIFLFYALKTFFWSNYALSTQKGFTVLQASISPSGKLNLQILFETIIITSKTTCN